MPAVTDNRKEIIRTAKAFDMLGEEETHHNLPPFVVRERVNPNYYGDLKADDDFIYQGNMYANFGKKSSLLRSYFSDTEQKKQNLSYQVLAILDHLEGQGEKEHLAELEAATNKEEISKILSKMFKGEKDTKRRAMLQTLSKIERINHEVTKAYRSIAKEQNPLYKRMTEKEQELTQKGGYDFHDAHLLYLKDEADKEDKEERAKLISQLEKEYPPQAFLHDIEQYENDQQTSSTFSQYFENFYSAKFDEVAIKQQILHDKKILKERIALEDLKNKHHQAQQIAQNILKQAFQSKGSPKLEEVIYPTTDHKNGVNTEYVAISSTKIRKSLQRAIDDLDTSLLSEETKKAILTDVVDRFSGRTDEIASAIEVLNNNYGTAIEKGVPPDARIEEIFQKMLEDSIYNEIMKRNGGNEIYQSPLIEGKLSSKKEIIDIVSNAIENKYMPIGEKGSPTEHLEDKVMGLHNINTLFNKIAEGKVSKVEARNIISDAVPFLNSTEKKSLEGSLNDLYKMKHLTDKEMHMNTNDRDFKNPLTRTSDFVTQHNSRAFFNKKYGSNFNQLLNKMWIRRKSALSLFACLQKAENPMVYTHSSSSETSQCMDQYKKELESTKEKYMRALDNQLIVFTGAAFMIVLLAALKEAEIADVYYFNILSELERTEALRYLRDSEDLIEQEFRSQAIVGSKNLIEEGIVKREHVGEYIFSTVKAYHDLEAYRNKFLKGSGEELISKIKSAKNDTDNAVSTRFAIKSILDKTPRLRNSFNTFMEKYNDQIVDEYQEKLSTLKKEHAAALSRDDIVLGHTQMKHILDKIEEGFRNGGLRLSEYKNELKIHEAQIKEELLKINEELKEIDKELKANKYLLEEAIKQGDRQRETEVRKEISGISEDMKNKQQHLETLNRLSKQATEMAITADAITDELQEFIQKKGGKVKDAESLMDQLLSQRIAYNGDGEIDDDYAVKSFSVRYSGNNAPYAHLQDLDMIDKFIKEQMQKAHSDPSIAKSLPHIIEQGKAMKSALRETYLTSRVLSKGNITREEAYKELFRKHSEQVIATADIDIHNIKQSNEKDIQVVAVQKYSTEGQHFSSQIEKIKSEENIENRNRITELVKKLTGLTISEERHEYDSRPHPEVAHSMTVDGNKRKGMHDDIVRSLQR